MNINFYSIFPVLSSLFILFLGVFVFIKQSKSPVNLAFSRFSVLTFIWLFFSGISYSISIEQQAFPWLIISYTAVVLMPVAFFHIPYAFLNLSHKRILAFLYIITFLFIYSLYNTDYLVNGLYKYYWGYYPKAGLLHPVYLTFFFLVVSACDLLLFLNWFKIRKETSLYKQRLQYILLAFIVCTFATIDYIPNYGIETYPFGWIFIVSFCSIIAYAILRYRLLDIYLYIKRTMAYSLAAGLLMAFFVLLVLTTTKFLSDAAHVSSLTITIFATLTIALLFNPLRNKIQAIIDRVFYKKTYDYFATIQKVSQDLSLMFDIQKIYNYVGDTVLSTLGLKNIYLLAVGPGGDYEVVYYKLYSGRDRKDKKGDERDKKPRFKIEKECSMVKILKTSEDIFIKGELPDIVERIGQETTECMKIHFELFDGEVLVPGFIDNKLSFLMILGEKLSGDIFTNEDVRLLNTITNQTAIVLKNARLYAEKLHSERFASMGVMSATFAHEVRNPLTSIKTFAQLFPEKFADPEFREVFSKIVIDDIEKIDGLIKDLLSFSVEKNFPTVKHLDIVSLVDRVLNEQKSKLELEDKKISVEKIYKSVKIKIDGDIKKLKQAFINIINNGCQAMDENGTLKVDIISNGRDVNIAISDTGKGIPYPEVNRIFDPFYTTKPMGIGLGLAISKKIIEDHGGSIKVESEVEKGTTFTVTLPVSEEAGSEKQEAEWSS